MKKGIKIELARNTNNSILPGKNKPFDVHRWLGFFFPRRILKSRGTRLGQPYILSFEDSILQNSFVGTCNDQGVGEQLVQDQRIQECLRKHRDFKYLEIGHADWSGTNNFHMLEVKTSTNVSLGTQPLEEALELVKTCLTLLEEFGVIAENVSDCS